MIVGRSLRLCLKKLPYPNVAGNLVEKYDVDLFLPVAVKDHEVWVFLGKGGQPGGRGSLKEFGTYQVFNLEVPIWSPGIERGGNFGKPDMFTQRANRPDWPKGSQKGSREI